MLNVAATHIVDLHRQALLFKHKALTHEIETFDATIAMAWLLP
jgi:hypothetical protein